MTAGIRLAKTLAAWGSPAFNEILKEELEHVDPSLLPLQRGLTQSSYVSEGDIDVVILEVTETVDAIHVKSGIFYAGIIAGSCCADDPTPVDEQTEYCEIRVEIDKQTAATRITLVQDQSCAN